MNRVAIVSAIAAVALATIGLGITIAALAIALLWSVTGAMPVHDNSGLLVVGLCTIGLSLLTAFPYFEHRDNR
jgi:hypothetical protein